MFEMSRESAAGLEQIAALLLQRFRALKSVAVAFSGGVDSAVVCAAAYRALGEDAVAVTGIGPAVATAERSAARKVAQEIGIRHVEIDTLEINDPNYVRNDGNRCFYCKSNLYSAIQRWAIASGIQTLVSGTNADDLGDYRPGLQAASNYEVVAPLAELKISKEQVRELARLWNVSVSEKPASPCLASRIAYGEFVSRERLEQIEKSEALLHRLGFDDVRVRFHPGNVARLEIPRSSWEKLIVPAICDEICDGLQQYGFAFVTMDLQSRQAGSLNRLLPILELDGSTK